MYLSILLLTENFWVFPVWTVMNKADVNILERILIKINPHACWAYPDADL